MIKVAIFLALAAMAGICLAQTKNSTTVRTTVNTTPRTTVNTTPRTTVNTTPRTTVNTTPRTTVNTTPRTTPRTTRRTTPRTTIRTTPLTTVSTVPPPTRHHYVVEDNDEICIIMDAAISVSVKYNNSKGESSVKTFNVPEVVTYAGSMCGTVNNNTNAIISLNWEKNVLAFTFVADIKRGAVLSSVEFAGYIDNKNVSASSNSLNMELSPTVEQPFVCSVLLQEDMNDGTDSATLNINDLKVQAFGIKNGSYTGPDAECPQMMTSSPSPRTPVPPPNLNIHVNREDNSSCLVFEAELSFDIPYITKSGEKKSVTIPVPTSAESSSSCSPMNATVQPFNLKFYNDWSLDMVFTQFSDKSYAMTGLELHFVPTEALFPGINNTAPITVNSSYSDTRFKASFGGYYSCQSSFTEKVGNVTLNTKKLKVQAFRPDKPGFDFQGQERECAGDATTDNIVPIAVGAALAALVVIVLIAYIIGRRRNRTGYQSV